MPAYCWTTVLKCCRLYNSQINSTGTLHYNTFWISVWPTSTIKLWMLYKVLYKQNSTVFFNDHAHLKIFLQTNSSQDLNPGVFVVFFQQVLRLSKKKYNPQKRSGILLFLSLTPSISNKTTIKKKFQCLRVSCQKEIIFRLVIVGVKSKISSSVTRFLKWYIGKIRYFRKRQRSGELWVT